MAERESQFITMSRQGIFVATAMGVGLLTFCYVIGVQVGKRSLTQNNVRAKSLDEELKALPEPLEEQLKLFRSLESDNAPKQQGRSRIDTLPPVDQKPATIPEPPKPVTTVTPDPPKPTATAPEPIAPTSTTTDKFTAQLIATGSMDNAKRVSERLKTQGFKSKIVSADGLYKVQLDWSISRAELDSRMPSLRALGYEPMAVKVQ
jgi:cell division septation protein DedD